VVDTHGSSGGRVLTPSLSPGRLGAGPGWARRAAEVRLDHVALVGEAPGMRLRVVTDIALDEPSVDHGFVTWLDVELLADDPEERVDGNDPDAEAAVSSDAASSAELFDPDEPIGRARVAIILANEVVDQGEDLVEVLDADSSELEALSGVFFEGGELQDRFSDTAVGQNLLFIADVAVDDDWAGRNLDLALVRRLCDTLGSGCALAVMEYETDAEREHWGRMGFQVTEPPSNRRAFGYLHLPLGMRNPRVVDPENDGRFRVVSNPSPAGRRSHH
jgi:predicted N-acetyltransferase YhbS